MKGSRNQKLNRQSLRAHDRESIVPRDRQNGMNRAMSEAEKFKALIAGIDDDNNHNTGGVQQAEGIQDAANEVALSLVDEGRSPFEMPEPSMVVACGDEESQML